MTTRQIPELPLAGSIEDTDLFHLRQGGTDTRLPYSTLSDRILDTLSGATFVDTVTDMTGFTGLTVGSTVVTAEFSAGEGGGAAYDVVLTSSVTPNTFNIIVGVVDAAISFVLRYDDVINVLQLGGTQAAINHGESILIARQTLLFPQKTYTLTGDFAIEFRTAGATYEFRGAAFNYGTEVDRAIIFGEGATSIGTTFDMKVVGSLNLQRTFDNTGTVPAATSLMGTGIRFRNVGDMDADGCYMTVSGFGTAFRFDSQDGNTTTSRFGKMVGLNCLIDFDFAVGSGAGDFTSALIMRSLKGVYNRAFFSDQVGSISARFDGITRRCDNIKIITSTIEAKKERKVVFDNCEGIMFLENYFDPGTYGAGGGTNYQREDIINASITATGTTISATAHGITPLIGDKVIISSADNDLDQREYIVIAGSDANNIEVNTPFIQTSTSNVSFTYYNANIEFTTDSIKCSIVNGAALEENVITDAGDRNMIQGNNVGYQRGSADQKSFDPTDPTQLEGLQYLEGALASTDIYTYSVNSAIQADSGIGHQYLGGSVNGYTLRMAGVLANPTSKAVDAVTCSYDFFTSNNPGGYHKSFSMSGSGILSVFGGNTGTERGEHQTFTSQGNFADLAQIDLPAGGRGIVTVSANAEGGMWIVEDTGAVTKIAGTTNTADVDGAGVLTVFQSGSTTRVRNRLGVAADMVVTYNFGI